MKTPQKSFANPHGRERLSRKDLIQSILKEPELSKLITSIARRRRKPEKEVWKKAENILEELVTDYHPIYISIAYRIVKWIWNRFFKQVVVDLEGLAKVKPIIKEHPVLLLPCHKSHMDYLLVSAIFYENGLTPPLVAAGVNLAFFPMGKIFRATGAYFIRRRISGDLLYARLLAVYVRHLIKGGYTQEFFIEGGRSRTGKLVAPKHGLLFIEVEEFLVQESGDLYAIPIAITYDRVPEESSYITELLGKEKEKESFWSLLRSRQLLKQSFGSVFVRFGTPISLKSYFSMNTESLATPKVRKEQTIELADKIIWSIASQSVVTVTAMAACALLSHISENISIQSFYENMAHLRDYLLENKFHLSHQAHEIEDHFQSVLEFLLKSGLINNKTDKSVSLRHEDRIKLDYYKNTILHFLLQPALFVKARKSENFDKTFAFLKDIFTHEFLGVGDDLEISKENEEWLKKHPQAAQLFFHLLDNYLEAYYVAARWAEMKMPTFPFTKERIQEALEFGRILLHKNEICRRESLSSANLYSALLHLHNRGMLKDHFRLKDWKNQLTEYMKL